MAWPTSAIAAMIQLDIRLLLLFFEGVAPTLSPAGKNCTACAPE
jgi:hypothetical protein